MKAIDVLRIALQTSDRLTMALIEDMRDAPLTQPTSDGGNHPLWLLGHLALEEGYVAEVISGEPNPVRSWLPLFGFGSTPTTEGGRYPPFDEVLAKYRELRARNMRLLERLGEDGLDQPTASPPPGLEEDFATAGRAFLALALHQMNHRGQAADARRAAGRTPRNSAAESVRDESQPESRRRQKKSRA